MIAVAPIRYFMVKYSREIITFDIDEALRSKVKAAIYRSCRSGQNIFAKLRDRDQVDEAAVFATLAKSTQPS
jgi:arginyl-tRNA synthetase